MAQTRSGHATTADRTADRWMRQGARSAPALFCALLLLLLFLRLAALDSDPYYRLSWSGALLTDEGYYMHNARNRILFGQTRTDGFNNYLIMPALHAVQVAVFSLFGVGAIQARLISVTLSMFSLIVFYAALHRAFGRSVALWGMLFLGFDHVNLLFNRMALMDTPAAFLLVCAFYAFVRSFDVPSVRTFVRGGAPAAVCGICFALAYMTRGLTAVLVPAPLIAYATMPVQERQPTGRMPAAAFLAGLTLSLTVYAVLWYLPHRAELMRVNHYYLQFQLLPHSANTLALNFVQFLIGDHRGVSSYLFRHMGPLYVLALCGLAWMACTGGRTLCDARSLLSLRLLSAWLLIAWIFFASVNYAPPRYYIVAQPALAAIAAIALTRLPEVYRAIHAARLARALLCGFVTYHLLLAALHHGSRRTDLLLYGAVGGVVIAALALRTGSRRTALPAEGPGLAASSSSEEADEGVPRTGYNGGRSSAAACAIGALWIGWNALWLGHWWTHRSYARRDADRWLAANLPPETVLLGDAAPGVCLNNRFRVVNVIPDLCNDRNPVERFASAPRVIVILDGKFKEDWWKEHYPQYVAETERLKLFPRIVRFPVGIYRVNTNDAQGHAYQKGAGNRLRPDRYRAGR